jgi:signal transduction histidine kinase
MRKQAVIALFGATLFAFALKPCAQVFSLPGGMRLVELGETTKKIDLSKTALIADETGDSPPLASLGFVPDASRFRSDFGRRDLVLGSADTALWLCFTLRSTASTRSWIVSAGPNLVDSVTMYIVDPNGRVETYTAGTARPVIQKGNLFSDFAFSFTIGPGELKTVYIRFASQTKQVVRASLWDSFEYLKWDRLNTVFVGALLGVIAALILSTLFIAISLRERMYMFYLVYLVGLAFYILALNGAANTILWPGNRWLDLRSSPLLVMIMSAGALLFARGFLDLRNLSPGIAKVLNFFVSTVPVFALVVITTDARTAQIVGKIVEHGSLYGILVCGIAAALKGSRRAKPFLVSWLCLVAGRFATDIGSLGFVLIHLEPFFSKGAQLSALAQGLVMSYGISDAINVVRIEKDEAQRRLIEHLERANKVKEDFLIGMSLEFRTPLYGIIGLSDRLGSLIADKEESEELRLAGLIRAESLRLLNNVANIALYARLRNADIAIVAERFLLNEPIEGAISSASYLAAGRDIVVDKTIEEVEVLSDIRIFGQIVYNLLTDAIKRSASGRIRIEARSSEDKIFITIFDSAQKLPDEIRSRFSSPGGKEHPEAIGPGLELLVTRLLAERLGGRLQYYWDGTCGRFELELAREISWQLGGRASSRGIVMPDLSIFARKSARAAVPDLSETAQGGGRRGMILAYDEDPVFLEALKRYLEAREYAVTPTLSADEAVALAVSDKPFDLALLDASGARRAGYEACARIRGTRSLGELPIVLMTDREDSDAVEEAFRAGASDYLPKLSPTELLFARVDTHVALRRAVLEALDTRRRVAELEKLKTLGVMAAGVAHEINTPNNAVIRNLPIISEVWRELEPVIRRMIAESEGFSIRGWSVDELVHEVPELLADTYQAGMQIKKIVEDLKDYARDSSGRSDEYVDLSAVAAYASRLLSPLISRSTKHFHLDIEQDLPRVRGNYQKLAQAVINILENALQALPGPDSAVRLGTRTGEEGKWIVLECSDEGVGIDPAVQGRIFEPFFTTKRDMGGTGLGLSVVSGIVRENHGKIEIESEPGRGTVVRLLFPVAPAAEDIEA